MAKSSFINKKVLVFMILIVIAIGVGVAVYILTKPKADLHAPYQNTFDLTTNKDYLKVNNYHDIVAGYLDTCYANISDEQATTNNIDKSKIKLTIDMYNIADSVNESYKKLNNKLLKTLAFASDNNGKMVDIQRAMTESYDKVLQEISDCITHIDTYLTEHKIKEKAYTQLYREVANYTVFYFEYLTELANFYDYASQIYDLYLVQSFDVNPITKQDVRTVAVWAKEVVSNISNYNAEFCTIQTLTTSSLKLQTFTTNKIVLQPNYYSTDNKNNFDQTLKCFKNLNADELIKAVARLNHNVYIQVLENDEQKINATTLCTSYFGVN